MKYGIITGGIYLYKNVTISGFSDEIDNSVLVQFEQLKRMGISYFDPRGVDGVNISELSSEQTEELAEKMQTFGIKAACIGSPIGKIKITDEFEPHMELLKRTIHIAKRLGTRYIRVFSFFIPKGENPAGYRAEVMSRMKRMAELAESEGVILLHENEKEIYGDNAARCEDILKTVASPALGCVFDPANFVQCGQRVFPDAYELLAPYITYVHIKDATADGSVVPAGCGIGEVYKVLEELYKKGYEGFLCLEPHLGSFTGLAELEQGGAMLGLEKSSAEKYVLAYEALNNLLERIGE